jgi:HD-like signal output (HDOD) protein
LSSAAVEICRRAAQDDLPSSTLATVIAKDPALAVKVLRIANSPFYGLRTQVKTLEHAIVVLGQVSVVSLCAAVSAVSALKGPLTVAHPRYGFDALCRHSVLSAVLSRWLAQHLHAGRVPPADAFMAGLLHDIGELAIAVYHAKDLDALLEFEERNPGYPIVASEHRIFGFDHQAVGAEVLTLWHLPRLYIDTASRHHDADCPGDAGDALVLTTIQAADTLGELLFPLLAHRRANTGELIPLTEEQKTAVRRVPQMTPDLCTQLEHDLGRLMDESATMIEYSRA